MVLCTGTNIDDKKDDLDNHLDPRVYMYILVIHTFLSPRIYAALILGNALPVCEIAFDTSLAVVIKLF